MDLLPKSYKLLIILASVLTSLTATLIFNLATYGAPTSGITTNPTTNTFTENNSVVRPDQMASGQGNLVINKSTMSRDGSFTFRVIDEKETKIILEHVIATTNRVGSFGPVALNAGQYTLIELVPNGWILNGAYCAIGSTSSGSTGDSGAGTIINNGSYLTIVQGQTTTCNFMNIPLLSSTSTPTS